MGNKADKYYIENSDEKQERKFAKEIGALYSRTSAKGGFGIDELFMNLCQNYVDSGNYKIKRSDTINSKNLDVKSKNKKCCSQ